MDPRIQLTTPLICPKCQGAMRAYERSGIAVDQCTECRGIFLDRGELERLLDAEAVAARSSGRFAEHDDADAARDLGQDGRAGHEVGHGQDHDEGGALGQGLSRGGQRRDGRRQSRLGGLFDLLGGGD